MRRAFFLTSSLGLHLLLGACSTAPLRYDWSKEPDPRKGEFMLGPSDELRITVWRNPELSTDVTVRPDGTITMPLIGDMRAANRTTNSLREEIRRRLRDYVKDGAVVTVALRRVNSYRFTVAGKVTRVGLFTARQYVTVLEAIAMAGGPSRFANPSRTTIIRRDAKGRVRRIPVDYTAVASGNAPGQNLVVLPGDTIFVP